ncbi:hypothetical protein Mal64_27880 [Pseudobythopirellula maris]|uniref:Heparan-alpha-glucosaminide N-acetyltransferase catalytic domain-containing protein n=1 Tax=Pseudobythopirellula maris TaxID=2527991 RepID=A0A5C5ZJB3_9BACT|nr:DUF5009 domain-containing protein [Pseudobythopirellula maris]TWT87250.1 hypothetical protein Mal64_27880 [Pseudobythopirellula maris]
MPENEAAKTAPKAPRLLSLDVMRGATILAMILVNNPGTWSAMYWPLGHATWHGWTPTDLIFPFFLYMVGVAMAYSLRKYEHGAKVDAAVWLRVGRRVAALLALGMLLNSSGRIFGHLLGGADSWNLDTLRWPGVLQRIALAYLGAAAVVLLWKAKLRFATAAALVVGYAALLLLTPTETPFEERLTPEGNIVRAVDLAVIGANHMYTRATSEPTDPEGLLSTLPSIATVLIGFMVGRYLQRRSLCMGVALRLLAAGLALAAVGQAWHTLDPALGGMPINKKLWTSSFVLLTGGLGTACLALCLVVFDLVGAKSSVVRSTATAFQMVGVNAILVFVGSGLVARLLSMTHVGEATTKGWLYQTLFAGPIGDPKLSSLCFALATVAFWWLIAWGLWRMKWTLRV